MNRDPSRISWSRAFLNDAEKGKLLEFDAQNVVLATYRPFTKQWMYFDRRVNEMVYQTDQIFPTGATGNLAIAMTAARGNASFSALMIGNVAEYCIASTPAGSQCFPMYLFEKQSSNDAGLFAIEPTELHRHDALTNSGLKHFQDAYPGETITKEDLFYYVYGLLHSEDYRAKYADNLSKELPRIPRVKTAADFWAFSRAGRELGDLHVNYETVDPYPVTIKQGDLRLADIKNPEAYFRVTKWAFGKAGKEKDKTTVIYNANITMQDIPLEAYDYVVNGKPALEWVMERQVVKTDKASGIVNDANRYAIETMNNPAYPLELFQRVITVSLRTMEIVRGLPKLEVM